MARVLLLVSSATEITLADGSKHPTGYFAEEALIPYRRFRDAGVEVTVATVDGRAPYADPYGLEPIFHFPDEDEDFLSAVTRTFAKDPDDVRLTLQQLTEQGLIASRRIAGALRSAGQAPEECRYRIETAARIAWRSGRPLVDVLVDEDLAAPLSRAELNRIVDGVTTESEDNAGAVTRDLAAIPAFSAPASLRDMSDEQVAGFDAVFFPGGHGPMVDLADDAHVRRALGILAGTGATIAALCHGPAALLSAPADPEGHWLFDGYRLTAFTNEEESQTRVGQKGLAWMLESALKNAGAVFDDSPSAWTSHVVVDRNLVTGQNPMSADAIADVVLKSIGAL